MAEPRHRKSIGTRIVSFFRMLRARKSEDFHELYRGPTYSQSRHAPFLTFSEILPVGPGRKALGPAYSASVSPSQSTLAPPFPWVFHSLRIVLSASLPRGLYSSPPFPMHLVSPGSLTSGRQ